MTVEALLDPSAPSLNEDQRAGVATLAPPAGVRLPGRTASRRLLELQARIMVSVIAGVGAAAVMRARPSIVLLVLVVWVAVHLRAGSTRLRPSVPDVASFVRHVSAPFLATALAVAVGALPDTALLKGLTIATVATIALTATTAALGTRRAATRVLLVGEGDSVARLADAWASRTDVALVAASLVDQEQHDRQQLPATLARLFLLPSTDDLAETVRLLEVDTVVVAPSSRLGWPEMRRISWALECTDTTLAVGSPLDGVAAHRLALAPLGGSTVAEVAPSRAAAHVRVLKSAIDRVAGTGLLVLAAPVLGALVLAIRLDSRGPGLFTQTRVGLDGRPFTVYKLRTMSTDAEDVKETLAEVDEGNGVLFKMKRDPRITRVGGFLRRTSLDELPQLINVVRGEMSLVGPRPALPSEVEQYDEVARRRLAVRPGMTGLWQVSGRSDLDWDGTVALDVRYTDNVSIAEDARICWRTVGAVTSGRGAY